MGAQGVLVYNNDGPEGQINEEEEKSESGHVRTVNISYKQTSVPRFQHIPAQAVP